MKSFQMMEIEEAYEYAANGGQALHLHRIIVDRNSAPRCFVRAIDRGENIAHLFDRDVERLRETARRLGVQVIVVEHPGHRGQHVDLCGKPLKRALKECEPYSAQLSFLDSLL